MEDNLRQKANERRKRVNDLPAFDIRVVIFTALHDPEHESLERHLVNIGAQKLKTDTFLRGDYWCFKNATGELIGVFIKCLHGAGNGLAGIEAMRVFPVFPADLVAFCGIGGSLDPQTSPLGSVVVSKKVIWQGFDKIYIDPNQPLHEKMREKDHFIYVLNGPLSDALDDFIHSKKHGRPNYTPLDSNPDLRVRWAEGVTNWKKTERSKVKEDVEFFDPDRITRDWDVPVKRGDVLSWEYVLNSRARRVRILAATKTFAAVEMESGAITRALDYTLNVGGASKYLSVRGISDLCSQKTDDIFREIGSDAAAGFLVSFLFSTLTTQLIGGR
ncbi:hypothetical protein ACN2XU_18565 [Primorskyibacter sp. 2E107]|uniref:phosphorylase family protein n=1 Tax=Primorskyibacter sp. 2E107 TaxID=3403458 RepID=UPI003AF4CC15